MKKYSSYLLTAMCVIALAFSAGSFIKVNAAGDQAPIAGQPVDLTYASEKALPAVVHIKYVQNGKTVEVQQSNPFSDFFGFPFGDFFGEGGSQNDKCRLLRRELQALASLSRAMGTS